MKTGGRLDQNPLKSFGQCGAGHNLRLLMMKKSRLLWPEIMGWLKVELAEIGMRISTVGLI